VVSVGLTVAQWVIFLSRERCVPYAFDVQQIFRARIKRWERGVKLMGLALGSILGSNHQRQEGVSHCPKLSWAMCTVDPSLASIP